MGIGGIEPYGGIGYNYKFVIKYTPFIYSLYDYDGLNIRAFDKKYLVSFMNRNDQNTEHLLITNY